MVVAAAVALATKQVWCHLVVVVVVAAVPRRQVCRHLVVAVAVAEAAVVVLRK